jgi:hypothetical protein
LISPKYKNKKKNQALAEALSHKLFLADAAP